MTPFQWSHSSSIESQPWMNTVTFGDDLQLSHKLHHVPVWISNYRWYHFKATWVIWSHGICRVAQHVFLGSFLVSLKCGGLFWAPPEVCRLDCFGWASGPVGGCLWAGTHTAVCWYFQTDVEGHGGRATAHSALVNRLTCCHLLFCCLTGSHTGYIAHVPPLSGFCW